MDQNKYETSKQENPDDTHITVWTFFYTHNWTKEHILTSSQEIWICIEL